MATSSSLRFMFQQEQDIFRKHAEQVNAPQIGGKGNYFTPGTQFNPQDAKTHEERESFISCILMNVGVLSLVPFS
jgi:hypothetical protein